MNHSFYIVCIANNTVIVRCRFEQTRSYFGKTIKSCRPEKSAVYVPDEDFNEYEQKWHIPPGPYAEYSLLVYRICDALLPFDSCIFHAAAFIWQEKAFLITAASGVGKSTQLIHWQNMIGRDLSVINGDKPVLKNEDGIIAVHSSPWKGKEHWGNDSFSAPLAGIIYLEQAAGNQIKRLDPRDAVEPLLRRFLSTFETEIAARAVCSFEDALLRTVPVWCLSNVGDMESAQMTRDVLLREVFKNGI